MSGLSGYRDRAVSWLLMRPVRFSIVVGVFALGVYASTASVSLHGYDPETAATAEGFVHTGDFKVLPDSVFAPRGAIGEGVPGKDGKVVGRAGLPEPLLMVPFYVTGWVIDKLYPGGGAVHVRYGAELLYNPVVAALAAALVFLIVLRIRSLRWAIVIAVLFTVGSIAWPYSKIGMDNTVMLGVVLTMTGAVYASAEGSRWLWVLAGFGAGMTVAAKAYEALTVCVILTLLIRPWLSASRERRRVLLLSAAAPIVLWAVAVGWYNWLREGSILKTGAAAYNDFTLAAPLNALGFYFSPGKGLLFYSPLILLGLLGLVRLWRENRRLAAVVSGAVIAGTVVVSVNAFWTDETWGPRYIVPVAWLLLLPIPWWACTPVRRRVLAGVAAVAVVVQLVAIGASPEATRGALPLLMGYPIYQPTPLGYATVPFGNDSVRWIPQLSPIVLQSTLITSWAGMKLGAPPITYTYAPFYGPTYRLTMNRAVVRQAGIPDFWWKTKGVPGALGLAIAVILAAAAAALLAFPLRGRRGAVLGHASQ